jgi:hypothetical protein
MPAVSTSSTGIPPIATVSLTNRAWCPAGQYYGALALYQAIEKARFAHVRTPYDGQGQPLMNDLAVSKGGGELQSGIFT